MNDSAPHATDEADFLGAGKLEDGIGLALSGGGFRAMLFHLGSFVRLNELGLLSRIDRIASVSGGSIAAGALACAWSELKFDECGVSKNLNEKVARPLLSLASRTIDWPYALLGLLPFLHAANLAAAIYDRDIFRGKTLQDLPDKPRFVFNATSLQTGALWRFAKDYAAEYRVGEWKKPTLRISLAVGASAAFPPFLSPMRIRLPDEAITPLKGADICKPPFSTRLILTDGGIYDNLGIEPIWKRYRTILVSDGGYVTPPIAAPWRNWLSQSNRAIDVGLQQGINMRIRVLRGLTAEGQRNATYWGIAQQIDEAERDSSLQFPGDQSAQAAAVPTRLRRLSPELKNLILKAGYAHATYALKTCAIPGLIDALPDFSRLPQEGE